MRDIEYVGEEKMKTGVRQKEEMEEQIEEIGKDWNFIRRDFERHLKMHSYFSCLEGFSDPILYLLLWLTPSSIPSTFNFFWC